MPAGRKNEIGRVESALRHSSAQEECRCGAFHNHDLKNIFKGAATLASGKPGPLHDFYTALLAKPIKPAMARLTLARKIAAITLVLWKKGERFDPAKLKTKTQAA